MPELRIQSTYEPLPRQVAFHQSQAKVRGYGGAMGGGKSRALCEDVFQDMLDHPGVQIPIFRYSHVSIGLTTKRTMVTEVIPPELLKYCDRKQSGGEDYIRLPNGSAVHFAGLDDPVRWFSSELGGIGFDEAHEIPEDSVVKLMTRLRQRDTPRRVRLCFNPENPGHYLYRWFIAGAEKTKTGHYKQELWPTDATRPVGDCEFVFAKPADNPFLPEGYVDEMLGGLPELLRRRYMEGEWLFVTGASYFDVEALTEYADRVAKVKRRGMFRPKPGGGQAVFREESGGSIRVYAEPAEGHTYAIGVDVATGVGRDYSAAYVIDLATMELVGEFHGKLDPDLYAEQLHFLGRWYRESRDDPNSRPALIAVESAGGFGDPVVISLRDGKGGRPRYPNLYRHQLDLQVDLPTVKRLGFPMNRSTRPQVLGELEKALRERALPFVTERLLDELQTFVYMETGTSPRAQEGCQDDCVMACAIALEMYRRKGKHPLRDARIAERKKTRGRRKKLTPYPWLRA